MTRAPGFPRPERISFGRASHAASLSAFAGSAISAVLFCGLTILWTGLRGWSLMEIAYLPVLVIMAGTLGSLAALPASLMLGAPILWFWGTRISARPRLYGLVLALVGAVAGWAIFGPFLGGGLGVVTALARYACPLFGAVVAGLHPVILAWIARGNPPAF